MKEIETSKDGSTFIDMAVCFNAIFCQNIITIACGKKEINDELLQFMIKDGDDKDYQKKDITIAEGIQRCFGDLFAQVGSRTIAPNNMIFGNEHELKPWS